MSVEAAVFDEDLVGAHAGDDNAGQVNAWDIALEGLRIADWKPVGALETDPHRLKKTEIEMVAGHGEDKVIFERDAAQRRLHRHCVWSDFDHFGMKVCLDFAVLDAVLNVRLDPVLHVWLNPCPAVNQRDARAAAPKLERGDCGGVFAADHHHVHFEVGMRIDVIVVDLAEILAGDAHVVGQIVIARRKGQLAGLESAGAAETVDDMDRESAVGASDALHAMVLAHVELVVGGDQAVILQRLVAVGLGIGTGKGNVADFEQLRRGEKGHVRGVVEERIGEAALVDEKDAQAGALGGDGAGKAGGAGADDEDVMQWMFAHI